MKRRWLVEVTTYGALLATGICLRLVLADIPNFAPVAALALFSGMYFRSWWVAASLPLLVMGLSDQILGGYDYRLMVLVHGALALPVVAGGLLRRLGVDRSSPLRYSAGVLGGSLVFSCLFFLVTNFGVWLWSDIYESTLSGLGRCFVSALPFFRYTLGGDLVFAIALFGGYSLAVARGRVSSTLAGDGPDHATAIVRP